MKELSESVADFLRDEDWRFNHFKMTTMNVLNKKTIRLMMSRLQTKSFKDLNDSFQTTDVA